MRTAFRVAPAFAAGFLAASLCAPRAGAGTPQGWSFDVVTTGNNVTWDSPTPVNPSRPQYTYDSTVTSVLVNARLGVLNIGPVDVTGQVPPDQLTAMGVVAGPAPATFFNSAVVYPPPPDAPGVSGTLTVTLDATGFGHVSLTNVTLGQVTIDLGPPFGMQTVTITRVEAIGHVTVDPVACPADLNGDGAVSSGDLALLLGAWGAGPSTADLNLDGTVNAGDLALLLGAWGPCPP